MPTFQEKIWSGRWDSNPRPQPWQGCALPLSYTRILKAGKTVIGMVGYRRRRLKAMPKSAFLGNRPGSPHRAHNADHF
jgi:hypothetical protein